MFCPNCGKSDQEENSFCRQCGTFLPDFDKIKKREIPPETHFKANIVLNIMSGVVSITLAILLYSFFLGREDTPLIIYVTAGFLTAMFFWQVQVFWRNLQLKKQFPKRKEFSAEPENKKISNDSKTKELLNEADFSDVVPAAVTENTTRDLKVKIERSS
jgi:hypothetical protein